MISTDLKQLLNNRANTAFMAKIRTRCTISLMTDEVIIIARCDEQYRARVFVRMLRNKTMKVGTLKREVTLLYINQLIVQISAMNMYNLE